MQSEILSGAPLSEGTRAYFQDRLRTRLYDLIIKELETYKTRGRTQAQLAIRVGKRPDQISRWLSGPGNWTLDTVSDLLLGISGAELKMVVERPAQEAPLNFRRPDWLDPTAAAKTQINSLQAQHTITDAIAPIMVTVGSGSVITSMMGTSQTTYAKVS
jgi:hypothetical protein